MNAATESVQAEWAARSIALSELRCIEDWKRRSGRTDYYAGAADVTISRFLRALGHGAVADQWERVR